ncbi:MAG: DUF433 domain-containing protein [Cytophagales bacterium]|nr:DUF433 domain-containing protein [Armatimonadota bacterium]
MSSSTLIVRDEDVLGGIPVFAGTRVPVKTLFDYLKSNHPLAEFLDDSPTVQEQHVQALLEQAALNVTKIEEASSDARPAR